MSILNFFGKKAKTVDLVNLQNVLDQKQVSIFTLIDESKISMYSWKIAICEIAGLGNLESYSEYDDSGWSTIQFPSMNDEPLTILFRESSSTSGQINSKYSSYLSQRLESIIPQIEQLDYAKEESGLELIKMTKSIIDIFKKSSVDRITLTFQR